MGKVVHFAISPLGAVIGGKTGRLIEAAAITAAGVISGNPQLIMAGIGMGAAALAKKPKTSPASVDRLTATVVPNAPRKFVFGNTALATDVRYAEWDAAQENFDEIICLASHRIQSVKEIWLEDKLAWTLAGGAQGEFAGYLTVDVRLEGNAGNTIAINGGAKWGATRRLTGLAYLRMRFKVIGNGKKKESPFAQSVPTRMTIIGEAIPVYDARFDSTRGGDGPMRADDQTTWAYTYNGVDIGRNTSNQVATYLLGWRINGLLAVGCGVPPDRFDFASFITAANACDEAVALAAGGTESRYRTDGIFSEFDDPTGVLEGFLTSMNGVLRDSNGQFSLSVLHNDLAVPRFGFDDSDVLGEFEWQPDAPPDQAFNEVRGQFTNPSRQALFQLVDYPRVRVASRDGIERIHPFDLALVQSSSQAQRLAKQQLARIQRPGRFSCDLGHRGWAVQLGDVVTLTFSALGWENRLFRVVQHTIQPNGICPVVLREEHPDIYLWDADERPTVQPVQPVPYDPSKSVLMQLLVAGEIDYADGSTVQALQPGEAGANVTQNHTSANTAFVGDRSAAAVNLDLDAAQAGVAQNGLTISQILLDVDALEATYGSTASAAASASAAQTYSAAALAAQTAAETARGQSQTARDAAQAAQAVALTSANLADSRASAAAGSASAAAGSASTAATSATAAGTSATSATGSANSASTSATNAGNSASAASTSASAAAASQTAAATSASASQTSRLAAEAARDAATGSASAAATSASGAAGSATAAGNSASAAQTSATNASTSAGQASTYAGNASTSASQASTSASNAAGSASSAGTSATNAAGSATAAGGSASAASGSASGASTSATNAGNSASAASGSANTASTQATNASNSASAAASSSASASSSAAAALQSASLSVQYSSALINPGSTFQGWSAGPSSYPDGWSFYGAGTWSRQVGLGGNGYSLENVVAANTDFVTYQLHPWTALNGVKGLTYVVAEADVLLVAGTLQGAGVQVQFVTADRNGVVPTNLDFYAVLGAGTVGRVHRFRKLMAVPAGYDHFDFYAVNNGITAFAAGARAAKTLRWYRAGVRPASDAEALAGAEIPVLQASVSVNSGAITSLQGRSLAYLQQTVNAGSSATAFVELRAEATLNAGATSSVAFGAREVHIYTTAGAGGWKKTLSISGNDVLVDGNLTATAGMFLGSGVLWRPALAMRDFQVTDGVAVAFGLNIGSGPLFAFKGDNLAPLSTGETYKLYADSVTGTGFTPRLRIATPGATTSYVLNVDTVPGSGPTRQIDKGANPDASNNVYRVRFQGTFTATAYDVGGGGGGNGGWGGVGNDGGPVP